MSTGEMSAAEKWRLAKGAMPDTNYDYVDGLKKAGDALTAEVERLKGERDEARAALLGADIDALTAPAGPRLVFGCDAGRDGECHGEFCPQNIDDGEHRKPHCPRDIRCGDPGCDAVERANEALRDMPVPPTAMYGGNSVGWTLSKARNYGKSLQRVWSALNKHGITADGKTHAADAVESALTSSRAQLERLRGALRQAETIARNGCLVPPDGGSPTESEVAMCDAIARTIAALTQQDAKAE